MTAAGLTFELLSTVRPDDPRTWEDKIFLTLDLDWAPEEVLADTFSLLKASGARATIFATHASEIVAREGVDPRYEIGIHPNFNRLLDPDAAGGVDTARVTIGNSMRTVPGAVSVRSHSLTQSSRLRRMFADAGITHESNTFIPREAIPGIRPWSDPLTGIVQSPIGWEDDIHFSHSRKFEWKAWLGPAGLRVAAFHPIHIALNTSSKESYEQGQRALAAGRGMNEVRFPGLGTRELFLGLLEFATSAVA